MTTRDFLMGERPAEAMGTSPSELTNLLAQHSNYLDDIAQYLRQLNADVLASAVVKGTSQITNAITDNNSHEVMFEVGGKPVTIYKLLAFSTYKSAQAALPISMSLLSMANSLDGWLVPTTTTWSPFYLPITTSSVHVLVPTLAASNTCVVNGPASSDYGGLFLYGFTIPDYDRIRGSIRS